MPLEHAGTRGPIILPRTYLRHGQKEAPDLPG
jgi:hypothetical protein